MFAKYIAKNGLYPEYIRNSPKSITKENNPIKNWVKYSFSRISDFTA